MQLIQHNIALPLLFNTIGINYASFFQLAKLRAVKLGDGAGDAKTFNWRNKQDLNDRTFKHYKMKTSASAATVISPLLALMAVMVNVFY